MDASLQIPPKVNISDVSHAILNNSDVWKNLSPELTKSIGTLIIILKAIGIVFLIYLVFLIVRSILNIIEKRRIKEIYKKVFEMDEKLDKILGSKKKK
jgi:hypothetical protein